jgi:hypothetical protein
VAQFQFQLPISPISPMSKESEKVYTAKWDEKKKGTPNVNVNE